MSRKSCRAIIVVRLTLAVCCMASLAPVKHVLAQQDDEGFVLLFDGISTAGWRGYGRPDCPSGWTVVDGALHRSAPAGDLMTQEQFQDFELRFEWKVAPGGNSGVMYRVQEGPDPSYFTGPEYQILDDQRHTDGRNTTTSAAAMYDLYAPSQPVTKPAGEWNEGRIVVRGNHVQHWLNGVLVVECEMWSDDWNTRLQNSKFAEWSGFARAGQGHIVLQDHGDPVWYRNLRIKTLEAN